MCVFIHWIAYQASLFFVLSLFLFSCWCALNPVCLGVFWTVFTLCYWCTQLCWPSMLFTISLTGLCGCWEAAKVRSKGKVRNNNLLSISMITYGDCFNWLVFLYFVCLYVQLKCSIFSDGMSLMKRNPLNQLAHSFPHQYLLYQVSVSILHVDVKTIF